jgi:hypothetical protein
MATFLKRVIIKITKDILLHIIMKMEILKYTCYGELKKNIKYYENGNIEVEVLL